MREIKFRVWSNELNKMVYADERGWYQNCFIGDNQYIQTCSLGVAIDRNGKQLQVLQYTGLKDKNGKEIYEGDIVHSFTPNRESTGSIIDYDDEVTVFYDIRNAIDQFLFLIEPRIIGNVHENPELLPVKN